MVTASKKEIENEWMPDLGPTQQKIYWDKSPYILSHGERFTGKTYAFLHKAVKHCYFNPDALAMITTITRTAQIAGGAWETITTEADDFRGKPAGILKTWEKEVGLVCSGEYGDDSKNKWVDIRAWNGKTSRLLMRSMPVAAHIKTRTKGTAPSLFLFEELTETDDPDYFLKNIQSLGRRSTVPFSEQQYLASCNPSEDGERHWVYKEFFVYPNEKDEETGKVKHDDDYAVYHIPFSENIFIENPEGYRKKVLKECRRDPTAYDRLILGKWVEKISGDSIFKHYYMPNIHIRGEIRVKTGLVPQRGDPIIIGYDPGNVNNSRSFLQRNRSGQKNIWRLFDESVFVQKKKTFKSLTLELYDKMAWWCERMDWLFPFYHIGDKAAFTHFNPQGSFDYLQFEKVSKELIKDHERFRNLTPIRMWAPDKGAGSVEDRVRTMQDLMASEQFLCSALCKAHVKMLGRLKKSKIKGVEQDYAPLKTATGEIHTFDSCSYPPYYFELRSRPLSEGEDNKKLDITPFS